jgi:2-polyprenyl-3-methyl-5-hydroxy-6-metoxy-1,4-benzoquinol methylase
MQIHLTACPVCNSQQINDYLTTTDFSVTNKPFELMHCKQCETVFTQNAPDQNHIGPYYHFEDYISHTNTNKTFFHKVYHLVRNYTIKKKLNLIKKFTNLSTGKLLDIGSGTGNFLAYAKKENWETLGIEADAQSRENALKFNNINSYETEKLFTLSNESYDVVTMWHVLEHVHALDAYLKQINLALKANGHLLIAVPNYTSYDAQYFKQYWAAYDVPRHLYHFAPKSLEQIAAQYGFTVIQKKPMYFDSFYVSLLSAKYKKASKIIALFIAFISNIKAFFNVNKCSSITYILQKK